MNLQVAAADFLSTTDLVAWEPGHRQRTVSLLEQFTAGKFDEPALRAALGGSGARNASMPAPAKMAVLRLYGVLTPGASVFTELGFGTSLRTFGADLRAAARDPGVSRIAVLVDSPGGFTGLVPETAALMRDVRAVKPVTAAVSGLDASAAFWISANATRLEATPSARIGSVGVYMERLSLRRMLEREGVDAEVISAGRFKAEGHPYVQVTDEERSDIQARVDESYRQFLADVADGRGVALSTVRDGFGQGRSVSARAALDQRMIDRIDLVENSIARAAAAPDITTQAAWLQARQVDLWALDLPSSPPAPSASRQRLDQQRLALELELLRL